MVEALGIIGEFSAGVVDSLAGVVVHASVEVCHHPGRTEQSASAVCAVPWQVCDAVADNLAKIVGSSTAEEVSLLPHSWFISGDHAAGRYCERSS